MAILRSLTALALTTLFLDATARYAPAYRVHQAHKHEARDLGKRQVGPPYMPARHQAVPTTSAPDVLTYITPSPGAKPIAVTEQSQYVTSFEPQYTLCELPPLAFFSASPVRPSTVDSTAPYRNYSISIPEGNGTCTTVYKPTHTMVCATTLTGLFDKWTVTQCDQELTFSTQYGYVLVTPTPTPAAAVSSPIASATSVSAPAVQSSLPALNETIPSVLNGTNATLQSIALVPRQASLDDPASTSVNDPTATSLDDTASTPLDESVPISPDDVAIPPLDDEAAAPPNEPTVISLVEPVDSPLEEPTTGALDDSPMITLNDPASSSVVDPTITPGPSIETLTTYYLAAWQELTAGTVPSDIDLKVCRTFPNGTEKCVREYESWHTSLVTKATSSVTSVNISTTIHGLSQIIVETYVANVTELLTTFSMSTTIDVGFVTEFETTHVTTREPTVTSTSPTVYRTLTVEEASYVTTLFHLLVIALLTSRSSETGEPSTNDEDVTSTITLRRTSTITTATITTTIPSAGLSAPTAIEVPAVPDAEVPAAPAEIEQPPAPEAEVPAAPAAPTSTDWAGMLGVGGPGGKRRRRS